MSIKKQLARIFVCLMLETGAVFGVPISPREIENLMQMTSKPAIECVQRTNSGDGIARRKRARGRREYRCSRR